MFSPSFECSRAGLRSAVRLRAVVEKYPDPERVAEFYMAGVHDSEDAGFIRRRIELAIEHIEKATS